MRGLPRGRAGSTLVLNILVMTVFAMTAVIVYAAAKSQVVAVVHDAREVQALAIAEAGLEDAMHNLYLSPVWRTGFSQKPFAGGYYTVTLTSAAPPVVTSTGYSAPLLLTGRAVKTVQALIEFAPGACPYAVMADREIHIEGRVDAYDPAITLMPSATSFVSGGDVRSNTTVTVGGASCPPAHIFGSVTAISGTPAASCVSGSVSLTTTTLTMPTFPYGNYDNDLYNSNLTGITPSTAYSGGASQKLTIGSGDTVTLAPGVYYFKSIDIDGTLNVMTSSGAVSIYLKNNFTSTSGCQINNLSLIPSRLHFYNVNNGNIVNLNCASPLHAYLEGTQANFTLSQEMYGHFCSDRVTISSATGAVGLLHYDLGGGVNDHVRWTTGPSGSWTESYARQ